MICWETGGRTIQSAQAKRVTRDSAWPRRILNEGDWDVEVEVCIGIEWGVEAKRALFVICVDGMKSLSVQNGVVSIMYNEVPPKAKIESCSLEASFVLDVTTISAFLPTLSL